MKQFVRVFMIISIHLFAQAFAEYCKDYGHSCRFPQQCCGNTCCIPESHSDHFHSFHWSVWNMWYFWFIVIFILMSCFGGCGYWRRHQLLLSQQRSIFSAYPTTMAPTRGGIRSFPTHRHTFGNAFNGQIFLGGLRGLSANDFNGPLPMATAAPIPHGHFPAPPPYSEVVKTNRAELGKDELPPYPGTTFMVNTVNENNFSVVPNPHSQHMTGLPSYSAANENLEENLSANQQPGHTNISSNEASDLSGENIRQSQQNTYRE